MILGVDPGMHGGLALVNLAGTLMWYTDMPVHQETRNRATRKRVDPVLLADELRELTERYTVEAAYVEKVHSMPKQGVASSFTFGHGYGVVLGVLGAMQVPVHDVQPTAWKKTVGLGRQAGKGASRALCIRLWPAFASAFKLVKHDGRAEAALIALHGARNQTGNPF